MALPKLLLISDVFCYSGPFIPLLNIKNTQRRISNPAKHPRRNLFSKIVTVLSRQLIPKKSIVDIRLSSKYATDICRRALSVVKFTKNVFTFQRFAMGLMLFSLANCRKYHIYLRFQGNMYRV